MSRARMLRRLAGRVALEAVSLAILFAMGVALVGSMWVILDFIFGEGR